MKKIGIFLGVGNPKVIAWAKGKVAGNLVAFLSLCPFVFILCGWLVIAPIPFAILLVYVLWLSWVTTASKAPPGMWYGTTGRGSK